VRWTPWPEVGPIMGTKVRLRSMAARKSRFQDGTHMEFLKDIADEIGYQVFLHSDFSGDFRFVHAVREIPKDFFLFLTERWQLGAGDGRSLRLGEELGRDIR